VEVIKQIFESGYEGKLFSMSEILSLNLEIEKG
jgi:hypothetical protein